MELYFIFHQHEGMIFETLSY